MRPVRIPQNKIKNDFKNTFDQIIKVQFPQDHYGNLLNRPDFERKYEDLKCVLRRLEEKEWRAFIIAYLKLKKWLGPKWVDMSNLTEASASG
jgi:hypothetical protein